MMDAFKDIYLGWKPATSEERFVIGVISHYQNTISFKYITDEVIKASRKGFRSYFNFPVIDEVYIDNVLEIFSQRLTPKSRFKTATVFKFWEISEDMLKDSLTTIAFTQAMVPNDTFEFLADFNPKKGLSFITDLTYTKLQNIPGSLLEKKDALTWHNLNDDNDSDKQILIKYENYKLGYVKKIHSNVFKEYTGNFRLRIHSFERRETLRRVFVKVELL